MKEKTREKTELFTVMVANKRGWKLNPDPEFYKDLVDGLTSNYNRYGYFLCPCRDSEGSREADKDSICPCLWSAPDVEEFGNCFCALYVSEALAQSGKQPASIPDRRYEQ